MIFGTKGGTDLNGGERYKEIFVFNLERNTTADDITEYMNDGNVTACEVECRSNEEARHRSFRVLINDNQFEKVMMADMWPENVGCRPYFSPRGKVRKPEEIE